MLYGARAQGRRWIPSGVWAITRVGAVISIDRLLDRQHVRADDERTRAGHVGRLRAGRTRNGVRTVGSPVGQRLVIASDRYATGVGVGAESGIRAVTGVDIETRPGVVRV